MEMKSRLLAIILDDSNKAFISTLLDLGLFGAIFGLWLKKKEREYLYTNRIFMSSSPPDI